MNTENEIWRDIQGYEGLYMVSNLGNVKSLPKVVANGYFRGEKILKQADNGNGYLMVCLCKDGKGKWFLVHRLVANAFIPNTENLSDVNHKDEDKTNNCTSNLEWLSHKDNQNYGTRTERTSKAVLQIDKESGKVLKVFPSTHEVERQKGYNNSHISKCCRGKLQTAYGYIWRYAA